MNRFLIFLLMLMAAPWPAFAGMRARGQHYEAALVLRQSSVKAGSALSVAIVIRPDRNWHIYWKNPGETGYAPTLNWKLPKGWSAGAVKHPAPKRLVLGGFASNVHEGETILLQDIRTTTVPADVVSQHLALDLDLLVCSDTSCVPDPLVLDLVVPLGAGSADPASMALFRRGEAALPKPAARPATFTSGQDGLRITFPDIALAQGDQAHVFLAEQGVVSDSKPQKFAAGAEGLIATVAHMDNAFQPGMSVVLKIQGKDGAVRALEYVTVAAPASFDMSAFLLALGAALVGGLILNLMPCVFPMISLKAMTLARAGSSEREVKADAIGYATGAIGTVMVLGGGILLMRSGGEAVGWAFQLQDTRVVALLLLLIVAIATNMAGLFELPSVQISGMQHKGGFLGSVSTGALAAVIATPCTGPFMAGALGAALILPVPAAMAIFMGLGLGLALPFLALGFVRPFRSWIPKPGNWMVTLRHILSLPMFVTALGLVWIIGRQSGVSGMMMALAGALLLTLGLWWYGMRQHRGKSGHPTLFPVAAAIASVFFMAPSVASSALQAPADAEAFGAEVFDAERLADLRSSGKPVLLYFTADWCLTCKVNEATSLSDAEVRRTFGKAQVTVLKGDWTRQDPAISQFLKAHGRAGVPLYLWYGADGQVQELPQVLTPALLKSLAATGAPA